MIGGADMRSLIGVGYRPGGAGRREHPQQGFSLVELMIGVVLVAVLLGVGMPSFRSFIAEQRLRATSSDLRVALITARSEAVKLNRVVDLLPCVDGWNKGWAIPIPPGPVDSVIPCPSDPDNPVPSILHHIQSGDVVITIDPVGETPQFSPVGRAAAAINFQIEIDPDADGTLGCLQLAVDGRLTSIKGACP